MRGNAAGTHCVPSRRASLPLAIFLAAIFALAACRAPAPEPSPTAGVPPTGLPTPIAPAPGDDTAVLPPPFSIITDVLLVDPSGFSGAPALSDTGAIFATGLAGQLYALDPAGELLWETVLPASAAGSPLASAEGLYALDRSGLNAFTAAGERVWRFEHESGTAIAGPSAGPDGTLYYTLQAGSRGRIQAVSPDGEPLWSADPGTHAYFRTPQPTPNGQFVLFGSEVFSTIDGSPVELGLEFEPESFHIGADRQVYLLYQDSLVRWTYAGGAAVLADERVTSPHELGPALQIGILESGDVIFVYPAAVAWFNPAGRMLHMVRVEAGFFTHLVATGTGGPVIACGRSQADLREHAPPHCAAFSLEFDAPLWIRLVAAEETQFAGGAPLADGAILALENGLLVRIAYEESP